AAESAEPAGRAHLWVEGQPVAAPLLLFGLFAAAGAAFANSFDVSDAYWFVAGPVGCGLLAWWYRRLRLQGSPGGQEGPAQVRVDRLYINAGCILLAAQSLIVLLAVDAPLGVAFLLLGVGLRLGSKQLAGSAAAFGVVAGLARYAVFNRLLGARPHHGPATPIAFALAALILLGSGWLALNRERAGS
ncbi:MAG TPA: hypothetical protein VKY26_13365, partial [Actinomycetota bacterium]|nr:hypothetical protein [Actinomycetota bacterium]